MRSPFMEVRLLDLIISVKHFRMFDRINVLKNKGYYPDTILDIGAHHGNWTNRMKEIYNSKYYLFEEENIL